MRPDPANQPDPLQPQQYQALLDVCQVITRHADLGALCRDLAPRLRKVIPFDFITILIHEPALQRMRLHLFDGDTQPTLPPGGETTPLESPGGEVWRTQQPMLIPDFGQEMRFPEMIHIWRHFGMRSGYYLPLTTAQSRLGAIHFASVRTEAYQADDLKLLQQVARLMAVAVDNVINTQQVARLHAQLQSERDQLRLLLEVNNAVIAHLDLRDLFQAIAVSINRVVQQDYASLALYEPTTHSFRVRALHFPTGRGVLRAERLVPFAQAPASRSFTTQQPAQFTRNDLEQMDSEIARILVAEGIHVWCSVPLISQNKVLATLNLGRLRAEAFRDDELALLGRVTGQITLAVENALAYTQIGELKDRLAQEKLYLEDEIRTEHQFEEIIGDSKALQDVLRQVSIVAPSDSTVLLEGETGTGKEVVARAIHRLSRRKGRTFVKVNCAAIPTGLLESELFGHERGAFTGAIARKVGRFELAHQGTLFLDEIGDIPLELQPKLLRVLQEQEFERLGSTVTQKVDVRIIAATNRELAAMVQRREFRSDLFYRLNVFPVALPPLRERKDDIPLLVRYFVAAHARRLGRKIDTIPGMAMEALVRYGWPGNVRELENFIERSVLLSPGKVLQIQTSDLKSMDVPAGNSIVSLVDAERDHILSALRQTNWVIAGPQGAATLLGMKRTTLQSKMRKLGIHRPGSS